VAVDPLIGTRVGNYKVGSLLGAGGMAQVYRATHVEIGREAALKVLSHDVAAMPDAVRRFRVEAQAVNKINHPNIVQIFDFGVLPDERPYYLMELFTGESLAEHIRRVGAMPLSDTLVIADAVLDALDAAHRAKIIHRDLKPDNVFLARSSGRSDVKLLDFGIAKLLDDQPFDKTRTGSLLGTPSYMSPEQCEGRQSEIGPATDIYAVGCMLYEMLSGTLPFDAESLGGLLMQHMTTTPRPLLDRALGVPEPVSAIIMSCLAKRPEDRPASAGVLRNRLLPFLTQARTSELAATQHGDLPVGLPAPMIPAAAPRPATPATAVLPPTPAPPRAAPGATMRVRSRVPLAAGAIAIVAAATVVVLLLVTRRTRTPPAADASAIVAPSADAARPDAAIAAPPPIDAPVADAPSADAPPDARPTLEDRLMTLKRLCDDHTFSPEECKQRRKQILDEFNDPR